MLSNLHPKQLGHRLNNDKIVKSQTGASVRICWQSKPIGNVYMMFKYIFNALKWNWRKTSSKISLELNVKPHLFGKNKHLEKPHYNLKINLNNIFFNSTRCFVFTDRFPCSISFLLNEIQQLVFNDSVMFAALFAT